MSTVVWMRGPEDSGDSVQETLSRLRESGHIVSVLAEQTPEQREILLEQLRQADLVVMLAEDDPAPGAIASVLASSTTADSFVDVGSAVLTHNDLVQERRRRTKEYGYRVCGLWAGEVVEGHPRICVMARGHHISPHRDVEGVDFEAQLPAIELGEASSPARS